MVDREEIRQRMAMAVPRLMDEECFAEGDRVYPIQNAKTVVRFSSHYGRTVRAGQNSSYSAYNLAGPAGVRTYGDHTAAMVLRTYGPWWCDVPSYAQPLGPCPNWFQSEDYIELEYRDATFPHVVRIRETYHPGSVVRILACNVTPDEAKLYSPDSIRWQVLWSGPPQKGLPSTIRQFTPELDEPEFPTRLLRIEFNSQHMDYYTELDCCQLIGKHASDKEYPQVDASLEPIASRNSEPDVTEKLFRQLSLEDRAPVDLEQQISAGDYSDVEADDEYPSNGYFDDLPMETWLKILGYLDFESLCTATRVSRAFFRACYDPFLYRHINLQPFWTKVNNSFLEIVEPRFHFLKSLDISWTGGCNQVSPENFDRFLQACCTRLTRFRAVGSPLVNEATLIFLNGLGDQLEELDVRSCSFFFMNPDSSSRRPALPAGDFSDSDDDDNDDDDDDNDGDGGSNAKEELFLLPQLTQLRRLNLSNTDISTKNAVTLIQNNPLLEHINVGSCNLDGTTIAVIVGKTCKHLKSLDLWRSLNFSSAAVVALAKGCPELQELDLGWLRFDASNDRCLQRLAENCPHLKKIFLTAVRTERDSDITAFANHCRGLEQLDLLGCNGVEPPALHYLLSNCPNMKFLDISFCSHVQDNHAKDLRREFPAVSIKKSFS
eukprot:scpid20714/ scgid16827/ F-box/LRR-repeat protein 4; F-box and leucine-rich repeat protein 4